MTMIVKTSMECPGRLKWAATGFSIYLVLMSDLLPLRWMCKAFSVSPTYCLLHFLHLIRYTRFLVLQVADVRTLYEWLVTVLWNVSNVAWAISILLGVFRDGFELYPHQQTSEVFWVAIGSNGCYQECSF